MIKEFYCELEDLHPEYHMHNISKILLKYDIADIKVIFGGAYSDTPPVLNYYLFNDTNKIQLLDQSGIEIKANQPYEGKYFPYIDYLETDAFGVPKKIRIKDIYFDNKNKNEIIFERYKFICSEPFVVTAVSSKPMNNRLEYYREKYSEFFEIKNKLFYVECEESRIREEKEYLLNKKNNFLSDFNS